MFCMPIPTYANKKKNNKEKGKRACYILPPPDGDQLPPCVILKSQSGLTQVSSQHVG
jgi:hypothetical protein